MNNIKVVFWAYRDWAKKVYGSVAKHPNVSACVMCTTREEVLSQALEQYDLLITVGLSEELGTEITNRIRAIGAHCAELDRYSYGTPLQLQILDGVRYTKHRIFSFTSPEDGDSKRAHTHDRMYANETILDLSGNMDDILEQMTATSKVIFNMFLDEYPNNQWHQWPEESIVTRKRQPKDSAIPLNEISGWDTEKLYHFFRCLEAPYPNGYIEDEKGRLYIERVSYKRKADD